MWERSVWAVTFVACAAFAACGGDSEETKATAGTGGTGGTGGADAGVGGSSATGGTAPTGGAAGSAPGGAAGSGGSTPLFGRCGDPVPAGAVTAPAPPKYSSGLCPKLVPGTNTIATKGGDRKFILVIPKDFKPEEETVPVIFLWHWLGGSAQDFIDKGEIQAAADAQRFIAVAPEKKGDLLFVWPIETYQSQARVDEELGFFDDMLSCVDGQYSIDRNCVASAGVSAGALFTDQLAGARGDYLSSFLSLSGGVGGVIRPWGSPKHHLPGLVLWGGPTDTCAGLLSFETMSKSLEGELEKDGNFFIECVHNCGHSEPPITGTSSKFQGLWDFVLDHPYWTTPGKSPYQKDGLPATMPSWCGIGKGSATPPTTTCTNPSQC